MRNSAVVALLAVGALAGCSAMATTSDTASKAADEDSSSDNDGAKNPNPQGTVSGYWQTEPGGAQTSEGRAFVRNTYRVRLHEPPRCVAEENCSVTFVWQGPNQEPERMEMALRQADQGPVLEATVEPAVVGEHRMWFDVEGGIWGTSSVPPAEKEPLIVPVFRLPTGSIQFASDKIETAGTLERGGSVDLRWSRDELSSSSSCIPRIRACVDANVTLFQYPFGQHVANGAFLSSRLDVDPLTIGEQLGIPATAKFLMVRIDATFIDGCSEEEAFLFPENEDKFHCAFGNCPDNRLCPGSPTP